MKPDPLLLIAAQDAHLDVGTMFPNFVENIVMWIDPGEVITFLLTFISTQIFHFL